MLKKLFKPLRFLRPAKSGSPAVISAKAHPLRAETHISAHALSVTRRLQQAGFAAYLVGGCVRDLLLGLTPKDFDVATDATPEQVRSEFRNARIIGRRFKLVHVLFGREMIEVATFRGHHQEGSKHGAQHESGRILRDNQYGTLEEDATRRDFSINALYFDAASERILDYCGGMRDIEKRVIRLIGDPEQRYQEDPVRMLRAVRFAAKLNFAIEEKTAAPIARLAPLLAAIPAARLFEEVLKLFLSGYALPCYRLLNQYGLFAPLFPETAALLAKSDFCARLLEQALDNTDRRIEDGKPVTPTFLFAALLWPLIARQAEKLKAEGVPPIPALQEAASSVLERQNRRITLPRRFSLPLREMVELQERLYQRSPHQAESLLAEPRFRAAYDLLLLRESAGEDTGGLGDWWTAYQQTEDAQKRRQMIAALPKASTKPKRKRRPRKKPNNHAA